MNTKITTSGRQNGVMYIAPAHTTKIADLEFLFSQGWNVDFESGIFYKKVTK